VKSRENHFYYLNPLNRFYQVLSILLNEDLVNPSIEEKKEILLKRKIGLFDVIKSCLITGSADASISDVKINDIDEIVNMTKIEKINLNGGKAYSLFKRYFPHLIPIAQKLPSTSRSNARYQVEDLVVEWKIILD
jgi:hypoxanthine-DNA glycosylase